MNIVRPKKIAKTKYVEEGGPSNEADSKNPSDACKRFIIKCIVDFYESETTMILQNKYVRYNEEC